MSHDASSRNRHAHFNAAEDTEGADPCQAATGVATRLAPGGALGPAPTLLGPRTAAARDATVPRVGKGGATPHERLLGPRGLLGRFLSPAAGRRADEREETLAPDPTAPDPTAPTPPARRQEDARADSPVSAPLRAEEEPGGDGAVSSPAPDDPRAAAPRRGWQQRLEESELGRGALSSVIVVTLIAIVAINLPGSELRRQLLRPAQPYLNALGLDQNWAIFAPDPRRVVIDTSALVAFEDGVTARWRFPHDGALVGTYRDYRWRKWDENLINPANSAALRRPAALWAARQEARPGHRVTRVTLVERFAPLAPPGVEPSVGRTAEQVFYTLRLSVPEGRRQP